MYSITKKEYDQRKKNRDFLKKNGITVKYIGTNGYESNANIKYSYTYNGVPGGFYIKKKY